MAAVRGLKRGGVLSLTSLGRHLGGEAHVKHAIKRVDRLLGNAHLQRERITLYGWLARQLLSGQSQPVIVLDGSDIDAARQYYLVRAAIPLGGRALPLYEEGYPREPTAAMREQFLDRLATLLAPAVRPTLITDAGFRCPWFAQVAARGWFYLGRVRNRDLAAAAQATNWFPAKHFYHQAPSTPRALGQWQLVRNRPFLTHLTCYRAPPQHRQHLTLTGVAARGNQSRKAALRAREPWLLASNLDTAPQRLVALYCKRMQIEESFRDLKSRRSGLALRLSGTRHAGRLAVLMLIAALTMYVCAVLGHHVRQHGWERHFQANTVRQKAVLSLFYLGYQWWRHQPRRSLTLSAWALATADIVARVRTEAAAE